METMATWGKGEGGKGGRGKIRVADANQWRRRRVRKREWEKGEEEEEENNEKEEEKKEEDSIVIFTHKFYRQSKLPIITNEYLLVDLGCH